MSPPTKPPPRERLSSEVAERVGGGRATGHPRGPLVRPYAPQASSAPRVTVQKARAPRVIDPDATHIFRAPRVIVDPDALAMLPSLAAPDTDSSPTLVQSSPSLRVMVPSAVPSSSKALVPSPPSSSKALVPAPSPKSVTPAPSPGPALFRDAAVAAHAGAREPAAPLRAAPPWTSTIVGLAMVIATAAVSAASLVSIDVTARAQGVMRPQQGGSRVLAAQGSGLVADVHVHPGDSVAAGDVIMTFDVASVRTELLETNRKIEIAVTLLHAEEERTSTQTHRQQSLAGMRERSLRARATSLRATAHRLQVRVERARQSKAEGLSTVAELDELEEQLASAQRSALSIDEEVAQLRAQGASMATEAQATLERLRRDVRDGEAHRDALAYALEHTKVVAPVAGTLDGVTVRPGDTVSAGMPVARIVPEGATTQIVAFLSERDRAFLTENAKVRVELAQLPVAEFGALGARVTRIGADVASPDEIRAVLGAQTDLGGPAFRVELTVEDDARRDRLARFLRPGSVVSARFAMRKRRVITIFFEPLRGFFP